MNQFRNTLHTSCDWAGVLQGAIVDSETGVILLQKGKGGFNVAAAARRIAGAVRIKLRETRARLCDRLRDEPDLLEEMCATYKTQYHLVYLLPELQKDAEYPLFLYLICSRKDTNLAKIRLDLAKLGAALLQNQESETEAQSYSFSIHQKNKEPRPKTLIEASTDEDDQQLPPFMRDEVVRMLLGMPGETTA